MPNRRIKGRKKTNKEKGIKRKMVIEKIMGEQKDGIEKSLADEYRVIKGQEVEVITFFTLKYNLPSFSRPMCLVLDTIYT
jgi:hypothetical protein